MLTRALIAVNVLVYLWQVTTGDVNDADSLIAHGALFGPLVMQGQWWRIVTGEFMHGGLLHIATNMIALYQVGTFVEVLFGSARMAIVYGLAMLGAGAGVLWFNYDIPTVGASGAIFGLFGALLAAGLRLGKPGRELVRQSAGIIGINLVLGFTVFRFVSNAGHIGGLVAGFMAGFALFMMRPRPLVAIPLEESVAYEAPRVVETIDRPPHAEPLAHDPRD